MRARITRGDALTVLCHNVIQKIVVNDVRKEEDSVRLKAALTPILRVSISNKAEIFLVRPLVAP